MKEKILCKLTDGNLRTHNGFQWELGVPSPTLPTGGKLCSDSFYHGYEHPLLAALLYPLHGSFENQRLFLVSAEGETISDRGLKFGCKSMTLLEEVPIPKITTTQRMAFAILCAKAVCKNQEWLDWAGGWLSGADRSTAAAWAAAKTTDEDAAWVSAWAATKVSARAADMVSRPHPFNLISLAIEATTKY